MWRIAAVVIVAGCGRFDFDPLATQADATGDADPFPDLIAWFPMDELVGDVANDATGHGHSASCSSGTCPTVTPGRIGNAYAFDGTSELLVIPPSPVFDSGAPFTVAVWISMQRQPQAPVFACVINKALGTGILNAWQLCVTFNSALFFGGQAGLSSSDGLVPLDAWHHVAVRWDGVTKTISFDGADVAQQADTCMFDSSAISIGMDIDNGAPIAGFGGTLDDVRIYGRALSSAEIQALASPP